MEMESQEKYMSITELSTRLNIKKTTLYSWVGQNKIPHLKIHGLIRFSQREINAWLQTLRTHRSKPALLSHVGNGKNLDTDEIVARAKSSVYNESHGETGPDSRPGKGGDHGAL